MIACIISAIGDENYADDQYLKMPDYTTREILLAQLDRAIKDGGQSFHLS